MTRYSRDAVPSLSRAAPQQKDHEQDGDWDAEQPQQEVADFAGSILVKNSSHGVFSNDFEITRV
jgi:hypothetical protein